MHRAQALRAKGRCDEAMAELRRALLLRPDFAEAHHQLGNLLKSCGRHAEARSSLREAVRLEPRQAAMWLNLGVACLEIRLLDEAIGSFRRALELEPGRPEGHNILGHALLLQGRCTEAAEALETALRLRPGYAAAHDNLGRVRKAQGRSAEAVAHHRAALEELPRAATHSNLLYTLNFLPGVRPEEIFAEHKRWAALYGEPAPGPASRQRPVRRSPGEGGGSSEGRPLRIGYVSPDLVDHAVAFFIEPVLASHDSARFEVHCYSDAPVPDDVTRRLHSHAARWRDTARWSDDRVEALIRSDGIDVLVDLAGHTARNRLAVFARRPAPVQATWLGYPNTTGLTAIDYRITDAVSDPPGQTDRWYSEKLVRLPETFSCYRPPLGSPAVGALPALGEGCVSFGCFSNLAKVTPDMIGLWALVLRDTADSRIILKSRGLADPPTAARIREEFARGGIAPERVELCGQELPSVDHLRLYHRVDIALDTAPYNGTTTTCEALWMGVPVVTLAGRTHASRVGASLLTHLGAPEWIATSPAEYRSRCRILAADFARLSWLRQNLRDRMRASPICDAGRFTRHLEEAYCWMARQRQILPPGEPAPEAAARTVESLKI